MNHERQKSNNEQPQPPPRAEVARHLGEETMREVSASQPEGETQAIKAIIGPPGYNPMAQPLLPPRSPW